MLNPRREGRRGRLAALACAVLLLASCRGIDQSLTSKTAIYATFPEAQADGAIGRGWVPDGLPPGATDLRVAYLSDGTQWGVLSFPSGEGGALRALVGGEVDSAHCTAPGRFEWWPRVLRDPIDVATVHATGLRLYRSRDGSRTFAVNWNQGRAFYWRE